MVARRFRPLIVFLDGGCWYGIWRISNIYPLKITVMVDPKSFNIDAETIRKVGLVKSDAPINAQTASDARIFSYPGLKEVYIMESDLYGNPMPKGSCFLAYKGNYGFVGQHLLIETLKNSKPDDITALISTQTDR